MASPTPEQDAYVARTFGVDPSAYPGGSHPASAATSASAGPPPVSSAAPPPASPAAPPPFQQPPDDVLRRAGDGALYWHPNPALQTIGGPAANPAGAAWIGGFLEYYWLAPVDPTGAFTFNRAPSDMASLTKLAADQAQLAGWAASAADVQAAADKILQASGQAQLDGHGIATSESVIADDDLDTLAAEPMKDILDALETIRKDKQLDTVARRAKQKRLRLGVLSVMHDLGGEWTGLMKAAPDADQEAVRKHVYGSIVADDPGEGAAPAVDPSPTSESSRALNSAEIAYVDKIFRGSIDYGKVKIGRGGVTTVGGYARTIGNTIHFPGNDFVSDSLELSPGKSDILVHEMTHVWQYQHRGWTYAPSALWAQLRHPSTAYQWRPAAEKHKAWTDLNPEAQAEAVMDYNSAFRRVISGNAASHDYDTLKLVKPWVPGMVAGPKR